MAKITTEQVKELRDATGISVMQCKNALEEANGDMEKALIILKKTSSNIAMKKAERNAKDGIVVVRQKDNHGLILTLHCETDFVAKNEDFINLANNLADSAINEGVEKMKENSSEMINAVIQKVGEKIEIGKTEEIEGNILNNYVHNNKVAVMVALNKGTQDLAKDIAMHIAAMKPVYAKKEDIKEEDKTKVIEVFQKEVEETGKDEEIKKKMLDGKINTYFKEQTLMDQMYIKDQNISIERLLLNNGAEISSFIHVSII
jgi:elongation factor Ts